MTMGYVKKENMFEKDGKPATKIGIYVVVKESDNMTSIYSHGYNHVTSKPKWSQAIKLAKLLHKAYELGREDEKDCGYLI